jgi:hypothetical protein
MGCRLNVVGFSSSPINAKRKTTTFIETFEHFRQWAKQLSLFSLEAKK